MITDTVDQLIHLAHHPIRGVAIRECLVYRVHLALLASKSKGPIHKIFSHFAPFNHCKNWLQEYYPKAELITATSTSEAARLASETPDSAAIAGLHTAERYRLRVVHREVASSVPNQTLFFLIGHSLTGGPKPTHSTAIFELPHQPGALAGILQRLAENQLNLTRIESRPIPGHFSQYRFMVEFEGSIRSAKACLAVEGARKISKFFSVLGSYPIRRIS